MKPKILLLVSLLFSFAIHGQTNAAEPKRVLVVTTTVGYRHGSIPLAEKLIGQFAEKDGAFTVDYLRQPEGEPHAPKKPAPPKADAPAPEQDAFKAAQDKYNADLPAYEAARAQWMEKLKAALSKLSPQSLANYDGVIFASTSGDLPIPDKEGLLTWIKSGKAFIGIHSASDTFHGWPEYIEMLGGEFKIHGAQVGVECLNRDLQHPATRHLGPAWKIEQEEIYQFKNDDPRAVHELLALDRHPNDKTPGHYPLAWCREYGKGKVFYTALGHRDDLWNADPSLKDRKNPVETSEAFQAHLLGGIRWALGLEPGDSAPQAK